MRERETPERQTSGAGVHHRFPPCGEGGVQPGEPPAERQLDVERGIHHTRQQRQEHDEGDEVSCGERRGTRCPAQSGVRNARHGGAHREVRGVVERRPERQAPQRNIAHDHREGRDERAKGPAAVERREHGNAEDVRGKSTAREGDAVAPRQRADDDQDDDLLRHVAARRYPLRRERRQCRDDRRHSAEGDERPHQQTRRRFDAGGGTHEQAPSKLGPVAVAVKRRYRLRMRVTIEYCVV